jgi:hypothetical protein
LRKRKIVEPDSGLLYPFASWMLRNELTIRICGVGAPGTLPVSILRQLRHSHTRLRGELTPGMSLNELAVRLNRVGRLGGTPILLLTAATCDQQQE